MCKLISTFCINEIIIRKVSKLVNAFNINYVVIKLGNKTLSTFIISSIIISKLNILYGIHIIKNLDALNASYKLVNAMLAILFTILIL